MKCSRKIMTSFMTAVILSFLVFLSCASVSTVAFEREKDFYYGVGSGKTLAEAEDAAKIDLLASALQTPVTSETAQAFPLKGLKPFLTEKKDGGVSVVYRYSFAEWNKQEEPRREKLRNEFNSAISTLLENPQYEVAARLLEASSLLARLSKEGLYTILKDNSSGGALFSGRLNSYCEDLVLSLKIAVSPDDAFVADYSTVLLSFKSKEGKAVTALPVSAAWKNSEGETQPALLSTDARGELPLVFPNDAFLKNTSVRLVLSIALSSRGGESLFLKNAETAAAKEIKFRHFGNITEFFSNEVKIPGGSFMAGAVKQDKRAESKEAPRKAVVAELYMDRYPVTNEMYRVYLEDTNVPASAYPDFWDNEDYNKPKQPVIGVTLEDAENFALWMKERFGISKRLPSEDEWENAAHGGTTGIYPWGDQKPAEAAFANFNGNGRFEGTSPVGSFEDGKNAYGLFDMAGNVWQWTSTAASDAAGGIAGKVVVKGGSWMDGQADLRVSTRRYLDPKERYGDVGFRLVREISK